MVDKLLAYLDTRWKFALATFIISLLIFSAGIGRSSIYILDESKNAQCAWEMLHSSNHLVPTFNGELRTDKPPLHYYSMMLSYIVFGKTPFAARAMSSLMGAILMASLALFVRRYSGIRTAFWSVVVLLSSIMWVVEFHLSVPDPYLITFICLGLFFFYSLVEGRHRWAAYPMYACFYLAFVAKGPIALLLPLLIIGFYLLYTNQFNLYNVKRLNILAGIVLFFIVALPWYFFVYKATDGEWVRGFLFEHNIDRFTSTKEGHGGIFLVTFAYFVAGLLPFIVLSVGALATTWRSRRNKLVIFSSIVVLVFLCFFSISQTKLPNYTMPCYPFAAILLGQYIDRITQLGLYRFKGLRSALITLFIIAMAIPVALTAGVELEPLVAGFKTLGAWLIFLPLGILWAIVELYRLRTERAMVIVATSFILTSLVVHLILIPMVDKVNPVYTNLGKLQAASSVRYYRSINAAFIFSYGKIPSLADLSSIKSFLNDKRNLLITSEKAMKENPEFWKAYRIHFKAKDIFDNNVTVIVSSW